MLTDDSGRAPQLISLADYEQAAVALMHPAAHAYIAGGAGDEVTMADNAAAWRRLAINPRVLVGVAERDPAVTILGRRRPHPVIVAPMAFHRLAHPEGEIATARAAAATQTVMCLATLATTSVPAMAAAVPDAPRWLQLYVFTDRAVSLDLVAAAADQGYEAIVVTVDLPVLGVRERELRSGAHLPPQLVTAAPAAGAAGAAGAMTPAQFAGLVDPSLTWTDVEQLVTDGPLPVIVKGILNPQDAILAAEHGARGIVVSNHGGRQLDTVLAGADALPAIVDAVGDRLDVLVDGGIRRGSDVLKALAAGARGVMVGRPVLWGLAVDGADGARRVLEILLAEFDAALALAGAPRAEMLDRTFLTAAGWASHRQ